MTTTHRTHARHPFSEEPRRILSTWYFVADEGARYYITVLEDGYVVVEGGHAQYVSMQSRVEVTGKLRKQPGTGGLTGRRAILHLDRGDGATFDTPFGQVTEDAVLPIRGYVV